MYIDDARGATRYPTIHCAIQLEKWMRGPTSYFELFHKPEQRLHVDITPRASIQISVDHAVDLVKCALVV